jgi:hypothetical protein
MSIATNLANVFTRIGTEFKAIRTLINGGASNLTALNTTNKSNIVAAINEVQAQLASSGAQIDDTVVSALKVWSSDKTNTQINQKVADLVGGSPELLNSLKELADAIGDDPNFASTMMTAIGLKADKNNAVLTGSVTVNDGVFSIAKTAGLQLALDNKITAFPDPNADRIVFWDDSAGAFVGLSLTGLVINNTTLQLVQASETAIGAIELATLAEVATGTDVVRAVTPAGLAQQIATRAATNHTHTSSQITDFASAVDGRIPATSSTQAGIVELATDAETATGTDTGRAVTPSSLRSITGDPETNYVTVFEAALV